MIGTIIRWATGDLTGAIERAYKAKLSATNDAEKLAADERLALLRARQESILAAQASPVERWVRVAFAAPFAIYLWKLVVWDKVLALGVTDALSSQLTNIMMLVIGGYFFNAAVKRLTGR